MTTTLTNQRTRNYIAGTVTAENETITLQDILSAGNLSIQLYGTWTGTITFDTANQSLAYYTSNAAGNWTVNFRGTSSVTFNNAFANNTSISCTLMTTQGGTAYYNSAITVDGNSVTPKWQGGTAPSAGNASGIDLYAFTIIKTAANTYTVLGSQTQYA